MTPRPLTPRQQAILDFIVSSIQLKGFPPSYREIGGHFGIRSTKGVNDHLDALERKGKIRRTDNLARAIEVIEEYPADDAAESVPVLGRIAAGQPLLASEHVEGSFRLDRSLLHGPENFLLRVQGDSMVEAHICDGDYVIVRPQDTAVNGEIVVALVDDEATVKHFFREDRGVRLQPAHPTMAPIFVPRETPLRILGRVVGVLRVL